MVKRIGSSSPCRDSFPTAMAIDPQDSATLYVGVYAEDGSRPPTADNRYQVLKSTDGGQSFSVLSSGPTSGVLSLAVDPQKTSTVYATTTLGRLRGVFRTTDAGES